ncbi:heme biosynthesis protein HemY [Microvirga tunisiensis]|uniref:Heme biosynthesis protein HemY n=1 Tax=Pannonibacter tanglangensis TaxID=2750084 RepID=A0A7X5JAE1_9HYPH|nr:heme biosynthesis HemY N-terminal domain-containing protein [Pannonibacter sp. XCT-53]NBN80432.1 heme biosynthesis protein HemY [Pannonibacter sp. XCT-53]
MIRAFVFFALLFAVALGLAWMADLPGVISIGWEGYVWEQPPLVALLLLCVLLGLFLGAVWLVLTILRSPKIASRFFRRRRRDRGYQALSSGLIALGSGNARLARKLGLEADKLLGREPAAKLLLAQAAQLSGQHAEARQRFEAMLDSPETRALGLHGLFIEAERQGEPVAARHYAEEALKSQPGLDWAGRAVLGYQAVANDFEAAVATLERNYTAKLIDKPTYRRHRAVLLTARALEMEDRDPDQAMALAKEAHGLATDLVPAAVVLARLATRKGDIRKATKTLEAAWKLAPHPDLADAYAHARIGDSALDRLKRVKTLAQMRAHTATGALAVARAALEARKFDEAREQLKFALTTEPSRGAFVLMAELEEAEHGDRGRMREWLARAVQAPADMVWMADGVVSPDWRPVSPVTGRLDAFVWSRPVGPTPDAPLVEDALFDAPLLASAGEAGVSVLAAAAGAPAMGQAPDRAASQATTPSSAPASDMASGPAPAAEIIEAEVVARPKAAEAARPSPAVEGATPASAARAGSAETASVTGKESTGPAYKPPRIGANLPFTAPAGLAPGRMPDDPGPDADPDEGPTKAREPGPAFFG